MKLFAIKNEEDSTRKTLAYLIYYEKTKNFYIELPENADPWDTPLLLSSFAKRRIKTVSAYWSRLWVQQRIVPADRQNLGQILKENNLEVYDEFALLMLTDGRCEQDSYYLVPVAKNNLPQAFKKRYLYKVDDVIPLQEPYLLVFFQDHTIRKFDMSILAEQNTQVRTILANRTLFLAVSVQVGGYGVCWGENFVIPDEFLYTNSEVIPLTPQDFHSFTATRLVSTAEVAILLNCSRQNIDDLVKRGKLHPIKTDAKNKLFLKSEIQKRLWT